eukprot:6200380-Pleurochrysis_carterae.AAC.2
MAPKSVSIPAYLRRSGALSLLSFQPAASHRTNQPIGQETQKRISARPRRAAGTSKTSVCFSNSQSSEVRQHRTESNTSHADSKSISRGRATY